MEKAEAIHVQPNSGTTMGSAAACSFSGCIMPAMVSSGQGSERLNAQLLVDSIPALIHTAVRVIFYRQNKPDGTVVEAYWLTDFSIQEVDSQALFGMAKSRWEIENQGFNEAK